VQICLLGLSRLATLGLMPLGLASPLENVGGIDAVNEVRSEVTVVDLQPRGFFDNPFGKKLCITYYIPQYDARTGRWKIVNRNTCPSTTSDTQSAIDSTACTAPSKTPSGQSTARTDTTTTTSAGMLPLHPSFLLHGPTCTLHCITAAFKSRMKKEDPSLTSQVLILNLHPNSQTWTYNSF
jgi:hypothetical protein